MLTPNHNAALAAMRQGKKLSAAWVLSGSPVMAEVIAQCGFDVAIVDLEHGIGDFSTLPALFQALNGYPAVPFVRAPWNDLVAVKRILDAGAMGLLIPFINTRQEAEDAVASALYPPAGVRGVSGGTRAAHFALGGMDYLERANDEVCIFLQIETPKGLENLDDILRIPRLDGIVIGPFDLATNMGHFANPDAPEVRDAIAAIEEKTLAAGKFLCTIADGGWEDAEEKFRRGYTMMIMLSDTLTLGRTGSGILEKFHEAYPQ